MLYLRVCFIWTSFSYLFLSCFPLFRFSRVFTVSPMPFSNLLWNDEGNKCINEFILNIFSPNSVTLRWEIQNILVICSGSCSQSVAQIRSETQFPLRLVFLFLCHKITLLRSEGRRKLTWKQICPFVHGVQKRNKRSRKYFLIKWKMESLGKSKDPSLKHTHLAPDIKFFFLGRGGKVFAKMTTTASLLVSCSWSWSFPQWPWPWACEQFPISNCDSRG